MNVTTNSQPGGWKSLPAELKAGGAGASRLSRSGDAYRTVPTLPEVVFDSRGAFQRSARALPGMSGLGMTASEIVDMIKAGASTTLPLIVAQTPGVIYTQMPDGTIQVYSQPTGTTANLPGVYGSALLQGGVPVQPGGTVTLPGGSTAQFSFGNMGEMMPMLVIGGLLAVVLLAGRK